MFELAPLILLFPLIGLLINLIFGDRLNERFIGLFAILASTLSFVIAILQWRGLEGNHHQAMTVKIADWITSGSLYIPWEMRIDTLSVTMMLLVGGVGTLIHIYASSYMHGDPRYKRFFIYLNLFILSMFTLVTANNYLMLFVGWEGVGVCSYLLIGFWYDKGGDDGVGNARAGRKAFVVNRIGDFGFLIAMFLLWWATGSLRFDEVLHWFANHGTNDVLAIGGASLTVGGLATAVGLLMLVGVAGKSAQIPLFVWLPDAMAGPTPVSALIHAATMVTAGTYLVSRSAPVLVEHGPMALQTIAIVGALTAFMAGTVAVAQNDMKKILAYSTVSQLGFMVAAVGLGGFLAAYFHLLTHAFFKALLFLGAGSVIHAMEHGHHHVHDHHDDHGHDDGHHDDMAEGVNHDDFDPQDMRTMGGLRKRMPITFWTYMIGALALAGVFPLSGFWSKDEILLDAWTIANEGNTYAWVVYILLTLAAIFTAFYMTRQVFLVFFGEARSEAAEHAPENPPAMTGPLIALAVLSAAGGLLNFPFGHGFFSHRLEHWLHYTHAYFHAEKFSFTVALVSTACALGAIAVGWMLYGRKTVTDPHAKDVLEKPLGPLWNFLQGKWFWDELYDATIVRLFEWEAKFLAFTIDWDFWHDWLHDSFIGGIWKTLSNVLANEVDRGIVDNTFMGWGYSMRGIANGFLNRMQTGFVRNYALSLAVGVLAILAYALIAFAG